MNKNQLKNIKSTFAFYALTTLTMLLFSSCATIFNGRSPLVVVDGEIDEPVTITTSAETYTDVTLPIEVKLSPRHIKGQHIQIASDNHEFEDIIVEKKTKYWTLLNIYNYFTGSLVDWATNSNVSPRHDNYFIYPKGEGQTIRSTEPFRTDVAVNRPHAKDFYRHEVTVSAGLGSSAVENRFYKVMEKHVEPYGFEEGDFCNSFDNNMFANFTLDYTYNINRRLGVGLVTGWGKMNGYYSKVETEILPPDIYILDFYETNTKASSFYIMPSVRYKWWISSNKLFAAYSQMSLGWAKRTVSAEACSNMPEYSERKNTIGYHMTFAGLEMGRGHLHSFFEIGSGYKGYYQCGLRFCF